MRKRVERLERFLAPEPAADPYDAVQRLALQSLATEDLMVLAEVIEHGKPKCQWTEREAAAVRALTGAFEQEAQRAGFRSVAESQRSRASGR